MKSRHHAVIAALIALCICLNVPGLVWASNESANGERWNVGLHRHDGFLFRYSLGGGFQVFKEGDVGGGISTELVLGGAISESVTLATATSIHIITGLQGRSRTWGASEEVDYSHFTYLQFLEVDYFFMPINLWIGAAVGAGFMSNSATQNGERNSEGGLSAGIRLSVGKEWWVSDNWGIGLMGVFQASSSVSLTGDIENGEQFEGPAFTAALQFTATFQ